MARSYENSPTNMKGALGARLAIQWLNLLLGKHDMLSYEDVQDKWIEGKDIAGIGMNLVSASEDVTDWVREMATEYSVEDTIPDEANVLSVNLLIGGIEVKTCGYSTFTLADNNPDETYGHVYFPIRGGKNNSGLSWLQRIIYPEMDKKRKSVQPIVLLLIFVYKEQPIFSIAFEDIQALETRIKTLIAPLQLAALNTYSDDEIDRALANGRVFRKENENGSLLYVPFDCLCDIATVTMIGAIPPSYIPWGRYANSVCPACTQQAKMRHVEQCAGERKVDERKTAAFSEHGFFQILMPPQQEEANGQELDQDKEIGVSVEQGQACDEDDDDEAE